METWFFTPALIIAQTAAATDGCAGRICIIQIHVRDPVFADKKAILIGWLFYIKAVGN